MFRYIIKRLIQMVPLLFIISFLGFGIIRIAEIFANADPLAQMKMSPTVTKETIRREKLRVGYEKFYSESVKLEGLVFKPQQVRDPGKINEESVVVKIGDKDELTLAQSGDLQYFRLADMLIFSPADLDKKITLTAGGAPQPMTLTSVQVKVPADVKSVKVTGEDGKPFTEVKLQPGEFTAVNGIFYFHPETVGKQLGIEYSTPNSFLVRYFKWISKFVQGDMGESYYFKSPVSTLIMSRLGNTVILGIATMLVTWLIAIPLGIYLAVRQYSFIDQAFSAISYFFMGFPDFFLAILLLLLAAVTGWFPIGEMSSVKAAQASPLVWMVDVLHHLILPTITLSLISIASLQRRMRANLLDVLGEEYIKTARAKGLTEHKVIYKHAVRNAINPIITLLGFEVAGLISGAAFVEIIFSWPGLGNMMLQAVLGTDLNLVMAGLMISTVMLLLGNLLADLLLAFADPRIKLEA
ncbi:MAG TPA: ABC transporter permease [Candidatus Obscuribacterales bacterium]